MITPKSPPVYLTVPECRHGIGNHSPCSLIHSFLLWLSIPPLFLQSCRHRLFPDCFTGTNPIYRILLPVIPVVQNLHYNLFYGCPVCRLCCRNIRRFRTVDIMQDSIHDKLRLAVGSLFLQQAYDGIMGGVIFIKFDAEPLPVFLLPCFWFPSGKGTHTLLRWH